MSEVDRLNRRDQEGRLPELSKDKDLSPAYLINRCGMKNSRNCALLVAYSAPITV